MRAPFAYYGGKAGLSQRLIALMPPHRVYMEPFFGSGAVFFAKSPVAHEFINDLDGAVVNFFKILREQPEQLARVARLSPYARAEWEACREIDAPGLTDLERARRFWVRVNQSFSKAIGHRTGWSATTARTQSTAASVAGRIQTFEACAERLFRASIECCPGSELIDRLATPDTCIYVDPPYLGETRRLGRGTRASDYRCDMGEPGHHERLAEVLRATPATVILSGYPSDLYERLYGDWWTIDIPVSVHSSNAVTTDRGTRVERIWSNRDLHAGRFDFSPAEASA